MENGSRMAKACCQGPIACSFEQTEEGRGAKRGAKGSRAEQEAVRWRDSVGEADREEGGESK